MRAVLLVVAMLLVGGCASSEPAGAVSMRDRGYERLAHADRLAREGRAAEAVDIVMNEWAAAMSERRGRGGLTVFMVGQAAAEQLDRWDTRASEMLRERLRELFETLTDSMQLELQVAPVVEAWWTTGELACYEDEVARALHDVARRDLGVRNIWADRRVLRAARRLAEKVSDEGTSEALRRGLVERLLEASEDASTAVFLPLAPAAGPMMAPK